MTMNTNTNAQTIEQLAEAVRGWNCTSIYDLRDMLRTLRDRLAEAAESGEDFRRLDEVIDTTSLPSASLSGYGLADYTDYPIWACDDEGRCLVGADMDSVESATAILAHYEDLEDLD